MSYALAARPTPLWQLLDREPYVTENLIPSDELSRLTQRASQVFHHYYDQVAVTRQNQILEEHFQALVNDWLNATRFSSSLSEITTHPAYRAIVELGEQAVPLLLRELQTRRDFWFSALREITGVNPVREEDRGDVEKMAQAWLQWGKEQHLSW